MPLQEELRSRTRHFGRLLLGVAPVVIAFYFLANLAIFLRDFALAPSKRSGFDVFEIAQRYDRWHWAVFVTVSALFGVMEKSFRLDRDHRRALGFLHEEVDMLRGGNLKKYTALCEVQRHLNDVLRIHGNTGGTFYADSATFWQLVESRLFPYLHDDEKMTLAELYHHPDAWKKSDPDNGVYDAATDTHSGGSGQPLPYPHEIQQSKAALQGLKGVLDSWTTRDRPPTPPAPPST